MKKTDLKPNQKIRVLIDGLAIYCQVRGLSHVTLLACLTALNKSRETGPCIGHGGHYGGHNVQIDVEG
jgi:hypothetical protein